MTSLSQFIGYILTFPLLDYFLGFVKDLILEVMKTGPIPNHMAFVMDGNRRYAKGNDLALKDGHLAGAEALVHVLDTCFRLGVNHVTIYAFSIENFNRPKEEVDTLFNLLRTRLQVLSENDKKDASMTGVRIRIIGNRPMIPVDILKDLDLIEQKTAANTKRTLNVCFPYTARDDIVSSIRRTLDQLETGTIQPTDITEELLTNNMYWGPDTPRVDILVRTSGHTRLSDFMLWQSNYNSTIELMNTLWPDFKFGQICYVILKWSYYTTLMLEDDAIMAVDRTDRKLIGTLQALPPAPPFASVTG